MPRPSAARGCRAGSAAPRSPRSGPASIRSVTIAVCSTSPRCFGNSAARLTSPTWWPARPMRCRPDAALGGASTWITRSTAPMSMPSSRLLVATTQRRTPDFSSSSTWARCSFETDPWWAFASTGSAPALMPGLRHHRRAGSAGIRQVEPEPLRVDLVEPTGQPLGETPRVARTRSSSGARRMRSTIASSTCGHSEPVISVSPCRRRAERADPRPSPNQSSSTGSSSAASGRSPPARRRPAGAAG